jgi:hypothetical protein
MKGADDKAIDLLITEAKKLIWDSNIIYQDQRGTLSKRREHHSVPTSLRASGTCTSRAKICKKILEHVTTNMKMASVVTEAPRVASHAEVDYDLSEEEAANVWAFTTIVFRKAVAEDLTAATNLHEIKTFQGTEYHAPSNTGCKGPVQVRLAGKVIHDQISYMRKKGQGDHWD